MELKALLQEEKAVSPVIGVILMVAITVILAAVIGTFVLGLGDQVSNTAPSASFTFDFDESPSTAANCDVNNQGNKLTITHDGGDQITASQIDITDGSTTKGWESCSALAAGSDVSAGDQASADVGSSDEVRIIWTASGGGDSATLGKWTGPDA